MSVFGGKADVGRRAYHTFGSSLQMRESRVDQFLIEVNFIGLVR
jgi:hypothetical protein